MKLKFQFTTNVIADQYVAVAVGETQGFNGFVKMNDVCNEMFEMLKVGATAEALEDHLIEKFSCTKEEAAEAVSGFTASLKAKGILED